MARISVVVPVFRSKTYLSRCIDSILTQSFSDFDLVLVDDGSPDNSGKICDEYAGKDSRVIVIHQQNAGPSAARNAGVEWSFQNSNSNWLVFIDSDDWIHENFLELLYYFAVEKNLQIVSCRYKYVDTFVKDMALEDANVKKIIDSPENLHLNYAFDIGFCFRSIYCKMLFAKTRFPIEIIMCEDLQIITPILYSPKAIGYIDEELYYYFNNSQGLTHAGGEKKSPKWINNLFSSHAFQLYFLKENKFIPTFCLRFNRFQNIFSEYIKEYGKNKEYKSVFQTNYRQAKRLFKSQRSEMISFALQIKKYGFKKWFTGQANKIDILKGDIQSISAKRGSLFALLWGIKSRIKIHRSYRQYSI